MDPQSQIRSASPRNSGRQFRAAKYGPIPHRFNACRFAPLGLLRFSLARIRHRPSGRDRLNMAAGRFQSAWGHTGPHRRKDLPDGSFERTRISARTEKRRHPGAPPQGAKWVQRKRC
jgi:hypothetical protein